MLLGRFLLLHHVQTRAPPHPLARGIILVLNWSLLFGIGTHLDFDGGFGVFRREALVPELLPSLKLEYLWATWFVSATSTVSLVLLWRRDIQNGQQFERRQWFLVWLSRAHLHLHFGNRYFDLHRGVQRATGVVIEDEGVALLCLEGLLVGTLLDHDDRRGLHGLFIH